MYNPLLKFVWTFILIFGFFSLSGAQKISKTVLLAGHKVHPAVATPATGTAVVTLNGDSLFVEGSFNDLNGAFRGAGIHYGGKNENGNQVIQLKTSLNENRTGGTFELSDNRYRLTNSLKNSLGEGLLYINIYTKPHPRGELRGQIPAMSG